MRNHTHFNLRLHDEAELAKLIGAKVIARETLREWPLSSVERITRADGENFIYKAQRGLSTELDFYTHAVSRHIPVLRFGKSEGEEHWLIQECAKGESPEGLDRDRLLSLGREVAGIISEIDYTGEFRYDLSEAGLDNFRESTVSMLGEIKAKPDDIRAVSDALGRAEVRRCISGRCTLLHGDMKCDNILITPDGTITIIDWQLCLYGPEEVDIYSLLATNGFDPVPYAGIGPELLRLALELRWFTECRLNWMKNADFLDAWISKIADTMRHIMKNSGYGDRAVYYFH